MMNLVMVHNTNTAVGLYVGLLLFSHKTCFWLIVDDFVYANTPVVLRETKVDKNKLRNTTNHKSALLCCCAEAVADEDDARVDEKPHKNSRCYNFTIWILIFV